MNLSDAYFFSCNRAFHFREKALRSYYSLWNFYRPVFQLLHQKLLKSNHLGIYISLYIYEGTPLGGIILTRENELIQRIKQGDVDAIDKLIEQFYPEILRYCLWHAPNRSLAEDATQETFFKVIRYFDRYTHQGKFKPFLYRVAANTCVDMRRKKWYSDISLDEIPVELTYSEPGFEEVQSNLLLKQLVNELPNNLQEIVLLRFGQGLTMHEISEVVNLPLRTVQSRLRTALKRLKSEWKGENKA